MTYKREGREGGVSLRSGVGWRRAGGLLRAGTDRRCGDAAPMIAADRVPSRAPRNRRRAIPPLPTPTRAGVPPMRGGVRPRSGNPLPEAQPRLEGLGRAIAPPPG